MFKKIVLAVLIFMFSVPVYAKTGDTVGNVLESDIQTYFYGKKINSYNIGGQTVVSAEDLAYYGFDVIWDDSARTLNITDRYATPSEINNVRDLTYSLLPKGYYERKSPNKIYETDIKVFLNGKEIKSYNMGGSTSIVCEDLKDYGYNVVWREDTRTLEVSGNGNLNTAEADIGTVPIIGELKGYIAEQTKKTDIVVKGKTIRGLYAADYNTFYVSLTDILDAADIQWSFDNYTLKTESYKKPDILNKSDWIYAENDSESKKIYKVYLKLFNEKEEIPIAYLKEGSFATNGAEYESGAEAYLYDSAVYIPWYTAEKIIS